MAANFFDKFDQAPQPQPQPMILGTPDPSKAYDVPLKQSQLANAAQDRQLGEIRMRKEAADAQKAQLEAAKASGAPVPLTTQQRAMQGVADDELLSAIAQARQEIAGGYSAGFTGNILNKLGGSNARNLAGSLTTIGSRQVLDRLMQMKAASPTGASGLGALSEKEGAYLRDSIASLDQAQSPDKLLQSLAKIESHYRKYQALTSGEDPSQPDVAKKYGIVTPQTSSVINGGGGTPTGGDQLAASTNGMRTEVNPVLAGVNSRIREMIQNDRSAEAITGYMNQIQPGLGDARAGDVAAAVQFRTQNPSVPMDRYKISVENQEVPLSPTQVMVNAAAGSPVGAYAMNAGDALSLGTMDNMSANPAMARAGLDYTRKNNPIASTLGTLSGGVMAGMATEGLGGAIGLGRATAPIADTLYGAGYGAGSTDDGNRLYGAGAGGLAGLGGGMLGRGATGMFAGGARGVQNADVQALRGAGVDNMTLGQIVGQSGTLGRILKGREDRLAGFSGIGDMITDQRRNSLAGFNRAAFNEGLAPIQAPVAAIGEQGVESALDATTQGYGNALNGVRIQPDAQFATDYGAAVRQGSGLTRTGPEFQTYANERFAPFVRQPEISGRQVQDMLQGVRQADFGSDSMGTLATGATNRVGTAIEDLVGRQAPNVIPDLQNANAAYRNTNILSDAVGRGMNTDGIFTPAQLGQAAKANANRFTGKMSAGTTDRPFFELQRAGQNVLPSKVPDSGTAGRMAANFNPINPMDYAKAGARAATAPLYSDAVNPLLNSFLLDRPEWALQVANGVERYARRPAGMFGRTGALGYNFGSQ